MTILSEGSEWDSEDVTIAPVLQANHSTKVTAQEGDDALLSVTLATDGGSPLLVKWTRGGGSGSAIEGDRFLIEGSSFRIRGVQLEDADLYKAVASNAAGESSIEFQLDVNAVPGDVPRFVRRLNDLAVKVGTRTRLLVEIRSATDVQTTWYKDDREMLENDRHHFLHEGSFFCLDVAPVTLEDAGIWSCLAQNIEGRSSCACRLNVLVPKAYKKPEFVEELKAVLTEGGTVSLECKVIGVPTPHLKWYKDGEQIKAGDVFALSADPNDPTTLGTYTCEATNCMGRAISSSRVHVNAVHGGKHVESLLPSGPVPKFIQDLKADKVKVGGSVTLQCKVEVPPWPNQISWFNSEGEVLEGDRYHLMADGLGTYSCAIDPVEAIDQGQWKCAATSSAGLKSITVCNLTVTFPKNYRAPRFLESLRAILTEEGLVSFECKVVGYPTPHLQWFKDGQELKPGDVYQLTGTNSLGSYCCIARNCMGEAKSTAELTVEDIQSQLTEEEKSQLIDKISSNEDQKQPPRFLNGLKSAQANINEPFRFSVQVTVNPEPAVTWYRDDEEVQGSDRLTFLKETYGICNLSISRLEFGDQAEWKCVATNDYGQSVTSCFLKLNIPRHFKKPRFLECLRAVLSDEGAVNLECKVIGVPQPTLKWYKDGRELKPGDIHKIISGEDGTCCLGVYTCEAHNCMGTASSSASLLGFEERERAALQQDAARKAQAAAAAVQALTRQPSLSTIQEERTSQLQEVSFSFDGKEVSVSLYETPDLTEEEALQIVEMYAEELSEHVSEHNVVELPPMRFVKETSTSGHILMEAVVIDVSPEYYASAEDDMRTDADLDEFSISEEPVVLVPNVFNNEDIPYDKINSEFLERSLAPISPLSDTDENIIPRKLRKKESRSKSKDKDSDKSSSGPYSDALASEKETQKDSFASAIGSPEKDISFGLKQAVEVEPKSSPAVMETVADLTSKQEAKVATKSKRSTSRSLSKEKETTMKRSKSRSLSRDKSSDESNKIENKSKKKVQRHIRRKSRSESEIEDDSLQEFERRKALDNTPKYIEADDSASPEIKKKSGKIKSTDSEREDDSLVEFENRKAASIKESLTGSEQKRKTRDQSQKRVLKKRGSTDSSSKEDDSLVEYEKRKTLSGATSSIKTSRSKKGGLNKRGSSESSEKEEEFGKEEVEKKRKKKGIKQITSISGKETTPETGVEIIQSSETDSVGRGIVLEAIARVESRDDGDETTEFDTAEDSAYDKSEMSVLESLTQSLHEIQKGLALVEGQVISESSEEPETAKSSLSVIESLVQPINEIKRSIEVVEKQIEEECQFGDYSPSRAGLTILETLAQPVQEFERSLALVEQQTLFEGLEESLLERTSQSILETVAQPLQEFHRDIALIQQQAVMESADEPLTDVLQSFRSPLVEVQGGILETEKDFTSKVEDLSDMTTIVQPTYAEVVDELQKGLTQIVEQSIYDTNIESLAESLPVTVAELEKDIQEREKFIQELKAVEETTKKDMDVYYDRLDKCIKIINDKVMNSTDEELQDVLKSISHFEQPLRNLQSITNKCIADASTSSSSQQWDVRPSSKQDMIQSLTRPLEVLNESISLLEKIAQTETVNETRGLSIASLYKLSIPMDELKTTIKLVENLSSHTAIEFLSPPIENVISALSTISHELTKEDYVENISTDGDNIIKGLDDSVDIMVNCINSIEKYSPESINVFNRERGVTTLYSLIKPLEDFQKHLHVLQSDILDEEKVNQLNTTQVYHIAQELGKPLHAIRIELSIIKHQIELDEYSSLSLQPTDIGADSNPVMTNLLEPVENVQKSVSTFYESIVCRTPEEPIHIRYILHALKNLIQPVNSLCSSIMKTEEQILQDVPSLSEPSLGLRIVTQSVHELRDSIESIKTQSHEILLQPELIIISDILSSLSNPLAKVEDGLTSISDQVHEEDKSILNINLLKTMADPFKILQKALININNELASENISEAVIFELKQPIQELQRSILVIQDQVSFEYGDEPTPIESNIVTLQSLIQPMKTLKRHFINVQKVIAEQNKSLELQIAQKIIGISKVIHKLQLKVSSLMVQQSYFRVSKHTGHLELFPALQYLVQFLTDFERALNHTEQYIGRKEKVNVSTIKEKLLNNVQYLKLDMVNLHKKLNNLKDLSPSDCESTELLTRAIDEFTTALNDECNMLSEPDIDENSAITCLENHFESFIEHVNILHSKLLQVESKITRFVKDDESLKQSKEEKSFKIELAKPLNVLELSANALQSKLYSIMSLTEHNVKEENVRHIVFYIEDMLNSVQSLKGEISEVKNEPELNIVKEIVDEKVINETEHIKECMEILKTEVKHAAVSELISNEILQSVEDSVLNITEYQTAVSNKIDELSIPEVILHPGIEEDTSTKEVKSKEIPKEDLILGSINMINENIKQSVANSSSSDSPVMCISESSERINSLITGLNELTTNLFISEEKKDIISEREKKETVKCLDNINSNLSKFKSEVMLVEYADVTSKKVVVDSLAKLQSAVLSVKEEIKEKQSVLVLDQLIKPLNEFNEVISNEPQEKLILKESLTMEEIAPIESVEERSFQILEEFAKASSDLELGLMKVEHNVLNTIDPVKNKTINVEPLLQPIQQLSEKAALVEEMASEATEFLGEQSSLSLSMLKTLAQPIRDIQNNILNIQQQTLETTGKTSKSGFEILEAIAKPIRELRTGIALIQEQAVVMEADAVTISEPIRDYPLEEIAAPLQELKQVLTSIIEQQALVYEPSADPMSEQEPLSELKTIAKPLEELQKQLVEIETNQILEGGIDEFSVKETLVEMAKPIMELQRAIATIEKQEVFEALEKDVSSKHIDALKMLAKPLLEVSRGIAYMTEQQVMDDIASNTTISDLPTLASPTDFSLEAAVEVHQPIVLECDTSLSLPPLDQEEVAKKVSPEVSKMIATVKQEQVLEARGDSLAESNVDVIKSKANIIAESKNVVVIAPEPVVFESESKLVQEQFEEDNISGKMISLEQTAVKVEQQILEGSGDFVTEEKVELATAQVKEISLKQTAVVDEQKSLSGIESLKEESDKKTTAKILQSTTEVAVQEDQQTLSTADDLKSLDEISSKKASVILSGLEVSEQTQQPLQQEEAETLSDADTLTSTTIAAECDITPLMSAVAQPAVKVLEAKEVSSEDIAQFDIKTELSTPDKSLEKKTLEETKVQKIEQKQVKDDSEQITVTKKTDNKLIADQSAEKIGAKPVGEKAEKTESVETKSKDGFEKTEKPKVVLLEDESKQVKEEKLISQEVISEKETTTSIESQKVDEKSMKKSKKEVEAKDDVKTMQQIKIEDVKKEDTKQTASSKVEDVKTEEAENKNKLKADEKQSETKRDEEVSLKSDKLREAKPKDQKQKDEVKEVTKDSKESDELKQFKDDKTTISVKDKKEVQKDKMEISESEINLEKEITTEQIQKEKIVEDVKIPEVKGEKDTEIDVSKTSMTKQLSVKQISSEELEILEDKKEVIQKSATEVSTISKDEIKVDKQETKSADEIKAEEDRLLETVKLDEKVSGELETVKSKLEEVKKILRSETEEKKKSEKEAESKKKQAAKTAGDEKVCGKTEEVEIQDVGKQKDVQTMKEKDEQELRQEIVEVKQKELVKAEESVKAVDIKAETEDKKQEKETDAKKKLLAKKVDEAKTEVGKTEEMKTLVSAEQEEKQSKKEKQGTVKEKIEESIKAVEIRSETEEKKLKKETEANKKQSMKKTDEVKKELEKTEESKALDVSKQNDEQTKKEKDKQEVKQREFVKVEESVKAVEIKTETEDKKQEKETEVKKHSMKKADEDKKESEKAEKVKALDGTKQEDKQSKKETGELKQEIVEEKQNESDKIVIEERKLENVTESKREQGTVKTGEDKKEPEKGEEIKILDIVKQKDIKSKKDKQELKQEIVEVKQSKSDTVKVEESVKTVEVSKAQVSTEDIQSVEEEKSKVETDEKREEQANESKIELKSVTLEKRKKSEKKLAEEKSEMSTKTEKEVSSDKNIDITEVKIQEQKQAEVHTDKSDKEVTIVQMEKNTDQKTVTEEKKVSLKTDVKEIQAVEREKPKEIVLEDKITEKKVPVSEKLVDETVIAETKLESAEKKVSESDKTTDSIMSKEQKVQDIKCETEQRKEIKADIATEQKIENVTDKPSKETDSEKSEKDKTFISKKETVDVKTSEQKVEAGTSKESTETKEKGTDKLKLKKEKSIEKQKKSTKESVTDVQSTKDTGIKTEETEKKEKQLVSAQLDVETVTKVSEDTEIKSAEIEKKGQLEISQSDAEQTTKVSKKTEKQVSVSKSKEDTTVTKESSDKVAGKDAKVQLNTEDVKVDEKLIAKDSKKVIEEKSETDIKTSKKQEGLKESLKKEEKIVTVEDKEIGIKEKVGSGMSDKTAERTKEEEKIISEESKKETKEKTIIEEKVGKDVKQEKKEETKEKVVSDKKAEEFTQAVKTEEKVIQNSEKDDKEKLRTAKKSSIKKDAKVDKQEKKAESEKKIEEVIQSVKADESKESRKDDEEKTEIVKKESVKKDEKVASQEVKQKVESEKKIEEVTQSVKVDETKESKKNGEERTEIVKKESVKKDEKVASQEVKQKVESEKKVEEVTQSVKVDETKESKKDGEERTEIVKKESVKKDEKVASQEVKQKVESEKKIEEVTQSVKVDETKESKKDGEERTEIVKKESVKKDKKVESEKKSEEILLSVKDEKVTSIESEGDLTERKVTEQDREKKDAQIVIEEEKKEITETVEVGKKGEDIVKSVEKDGKAKESKKEVEDKTKIETKDAEIKESKTEENIVSEKPKKDAKDKIKKKDNKIKEPVKKDKDITKDVKEKSKDKPKNEEVKDVTETSGKEALEKEQKEILENSKQKIKEVQIENKEQKKLETEEFMKKSKEENLQKEIEEKEVRVKSVKEGDILTKTESMKERESRKQSIKSSEKLETKGDIKRKMSEEKESKTELKEKSYKQNGEIKQSDYINDTEYFDDKIKQEDTYNKRSELYTKTSIETDKYSSYKKYDKIETIKDRTEKRVSILDNDSYNKSSAEYRKERMLNKASIDDKRSARCKSEEYRMWSSTTSEPKIKKYPHDSSSSESTAQPPKQIWTRRESKCKPYFCGRLMDRTAPQGSRVKMSCSFIGNPEPTIKFMKDGLPLLFSSADPLAHRFDTRISNGIATLEIHSASPGDCGRYTCVAANPHGEATTTATLRIFTPFEPTPIAPTFTKRIQDQYKFNDDQLILECRVTGQPHPITTWLKDGKELPARGRYQQTEMTNGTCQLTIFGPEPSDSGFYTCKAQNVISTEQISDLITFQGRANYSAEKEKERLSKLNFDSRRPEVVNLMTDHVIPAGGMLALHVQVKGLPNPNVRWFRGSEPVEKRAVTLHEGNLYSLVLPNVEPDEAGLYTCRASNVYGHIDTSAHVQVVSASNEVRGKPAFFIRRPDTRLSIAEGEDISVSLRISGDPKPRVTWMKGLKDMNGCARSMKETIGDCVRLTLKRSTQWDAGTYFITAKNIYGSDRAFFTVYVRQRARSLTPLSWDTSDTEILLKDIHQMVQSSLRDVPGVVDSEPVVTDGGRTWLTLTWSKPRHVGAGPILAYKVEAWQLGEDGGARWEELGVTPITTFDAFELKAGASYKFRVTARNRYGWGEPTVTREPIIAGCQHLRPEIITDLPGQLKALQSTNLTLQCEIRGEPQPDIRWYHDGREVAISRGKDDRLAVRLKGGLCSLLIKDLRSEDSGRYICEATNKLGRASTFVRLLVVQEPRLLKAANQLKRIQDGDDIEVTTLDSPPQFCLRLRDRRVQASYPVRLTCQVVGYPSPDISWFKDGEQIQEDDRHSFWNEDHFLTLELSRARIEDSGQYSVTARNEHGAVSCRCQLIVDKGIKDYVSPGFLYGIDEKATLKEGRELRLRAQVEAYPAVGITWHRDGVRLRQSRRLVITLDKEGRTELSLADITIRDAGLYCCTAVNEVGRAETTCQVVVQPRIGGPVQSTVLPPLLSSTAHSDLPYTKAPMFLTKPRSTEAVEGDTVVIMCEVLGDPKPEVVWLRDWLKPGYYRDAPQFLCSGEGPQYRLEIPHVKLDFIGAYCVLARNEHGEARAVISLQVFARGQGIKKDMNSGQVGVKQSNIQTLPEIIRELKDLRCCDGDSVTLECKVYAQPLPDVRWLKDGKILPIGGDIISDLDSDVARLTIQKVYPEDEGEYTCMAYNDLGRALTSACLIVDVPEEKEVMVSRQLVKPPGFLSTPSTPRTTPSRSISPGIQVSRDFTTPAGLSTNRTRRPKSSSPKFYAVPHNKVAEEGETVRFQCSVAGHPIPWASWDKDGHIVTPSARFSIIEQDDLRMLQIKEVTQEDAGLYRVTLENDYGSVEATARLEVIGHRASRAKGLRAWSASRASPTFGRRLVGSAARVGGTFTLACDVQATPSPVITWYRNGEAVIKTSRTLPIWDGRTARLKLKDLESDDAGVYTCVAENELGITRCSAELVVLGVTDPSDADLRPPVFVNGLPELTPATEGQSFELQVKLQGTQPLEVVWVKDDEELPDCSDFRYVDYGDGRFGLRIADVFTADAGIYACEAFNPHGDAITSGRLEVVDAADSSESKKKQLYFTKTPTPLDVEPGNSASFCARLHSPADMPMHISWSVAGQPVLKNCDRFKIEQDGDSTMLRIDPVLSIDIGAVNCRAHICSEGHNEPSIGCTKCYVVSCTSRLATTSESSGDRPAILFQGPEDTTALRGQKVVLKALFSGHPYPSVRWLKAGRELSSEGCMQIITNIDKISSEGESSLILDPVSSDDSGKYVISVENCLGADCHFASVAVEGPPDPPAGRLSIIPMDDNSVTIAWSSPPYDGGCMVTGYRIEMKNNSDSDWSVVADRCHSLSHVVHGLSTGQHYVFRVRAENVHGASQPSIESQSVLIGRQLDDNTDDEESYQIINNEPVQIESGDEFVTRFEVLEELGKGRYGVVHKVLDRKSDTNMAAKFVRCIKKQDKQKVQEEIDIMNCLRHPKLLQLTAAFENSREIIMVMEYITGGELFERVVADDFTLTERDCIVFMRQICEGVEYMHKSNIVHLDLKPENIMCHTRTSHQIKVIDFGLAQKLVPNTTLRVMFGTPEFIPPEIINYEPIGVETDMWSLGVICYVLLSGLSPFMGDNDAETFANITRADFDFDDEAFDAISQDAKDFISGLLIKRKEKRMSATECLKHKWMTQNDTNMSCVKISTDKLKKFIIRRKWQKTGNAIRALGRMATLSAASRRNSSSPRPSLSSGPGSPRSRMSSLTSTDDQAHCANVTSDNVKQTRVRMCSERSDSGFSDCSSHYSSATPQIINSTFSITEENELCYDNNDCVNKILPDRLNSDVNNRFDDDNVDFNKIDNKISCNPSNNNNSSSTCSSSSSSNNSSTKQPSLVRSSPFLKNNFADGTSSLQTNNKDINVLSSSTANKRETTSCVKSQLTTPEKNFQKEKSPTLQKDARILEKSDNFQKAFAFWKR